MNSLADLGLVPGMPVSALDETLRSANDENRLSNRKLAFGLHEMDQRRAQQQLGFRTVAQYAEQVLEMPERRVHELVQIGRALERLPRIDQAFLDEKIGWSKVKLLMRVAQIEDQDQWVECAIGRTCRQLEVDVSQARHGGGPGAVESGFPQPLTRVLADFPPAVYERFERARQRLMRESSTLVTDSEVLVAFVQRGDLGDPDPEELAIREAECEDDETPEELRLDILARDHARCRCCGSTNRLHVHHIVFRSRGGKTIPSNLITLCGACHGLVHAGRLFIHGTAPHDLKIRNRDGETVAKHPSDTRASPATRAAPLLPAVTDRAKASPSLLDPIHPASQTAAHVTRPSIGSTTRSHN